MIDRVKLVTTIKDTRRLLIELHHANGEQRTQLERTIDQLSEALNELEQWTAASPSPAPDQSETSRSAAAWSPDAGRK